MLLWQLAGRFLAGFVTLLAVSFVGAVELLSRLLG